jgi:biotin carboxyl carrier protein
MALYQVTIENRIYQVNISGDSSTVDGETVDAKVVRLNRNGLHMMRRGKQALELFLSTLDDETYQMVMFGGRRIVTRISSHLGKHAKSSAAESQDHILAAPMHGLVVDVRVNVGDIVEADKTLVVLESMKMQMQLRSKRAGKIARVDVQSGSQVVKGAVLIQFEQPGPEEKSHE